MTNPLLPFLFHHANRADKYGPTREAFYKIKDRLLKGLPIVGYDVQHIEGKRCWTCGGTGIYTGYYEMSCDKWSDNCNRCWRGWYKLPQWICLGIYKYGRYTFHRPLKRHHCVDNPFSKEEIGWDVSQTVIEGFIDHSSTKYSKRALIILFLLFDFRGYWIRWWHQDWWFRVHWYYPSNWLHTIMHIIKHGRNSTPFRYFKEIHDQNVYEQQNPSPF